MNEKEAREIIHDPNRKGLTYDAFQAKGYLEAIEKAKPLVEAIKFYLTPHNPNICSCRSGSWDDKFKAVLAQWEKEM